MTRSPGTNYLDSEIIKVFRRERKKRKMLVIFSGLSLSRSQKLVGKTDVNLGKRKKDFV